MECIAYLRCSCGDHVTVGRWAPKPTRFGWKWSCASTKMADETLLSGNLFVAKHQIKIKIVTEDENNGKEQNARKTANKRNLVENCARTILFSMSSGFYSVARQFDSVSGFGWRKNRPHPFVYDA